MNYKAAIFDLDGTLLDTLDDLWDAVNHTMDVYGFPRRTRNEVRAFVGNGVERLIALSVPDGLENPKFPEAVTSYRAYYAANSEHKTAPYDGVIDLIRTLIADGIAVSVVSNKPHGSTVTLCAKYFPEISVVCGEREAEGIRRKPYPDTVFKAVQDLGLDVNDCVYIGDSEVDIKTARNAGMDCISVLWGFRDEDELREAGGTVFVRTADELYDAIVK
ncbi:MAG: HAD family hydrolase [Clostridia bacterium]|nr:HAD family hydrolase [Clostridia bacterium]